MDMNLSKLWEIVKDRGTWHAAAHGAAKSQTRQSWTELRFPEVVIQKVTKHPRAGKQKEEVGIIKP